MQYLLEGSLVIQLWIYHIGWYRGAWGDPTNIFTSIYFCKTLHSPSFSPWVLNKPVFLTILNSESDNQKWVTLYWSRLAILRCTVYSTLVWKEVRLQVKYCGDWSYISNGSHHLLFIIYSYPFVPIWAYDLNAIHWIIELALSYFIR